MAKIIKKGRYCTVKEYEEHDPIYSEGWTIGSVIRPKQSEQDSESKELESEEPRKEE